METKRSIIIELTVNNHPGVMAHITGLFSRRAFNLEGILCASLDSDQSKSSVYLLVGWNEKLDQVLRQLGKLYDVLAVAVRKDCDHGVFRQLHRFLHDKAFVEKSGEGYLGML
jgi:acetolactate synthase-1/3 small subunit